METLSCALSAISRYCSSYAELPRRETGITTDITDVDVRAMREEPVDVIRPRAMIHRLLSFSVFYQAVRPSESMRPER